LGRHKTPTHILKIRGSRKVADRKGEPTPEVGRPKQPAGLPKEAAKVWRHVCDILSRMGVLTLADGQQLERYARMFAQWRRAQEVVDSFDTPEAMANAFESDLKRPVIRNAMMAASRLDTALKQIESSFGMTPSARARIGCLMNGKPDAPADPVEAKYFGGA
jgi:P27 family predicted phage terminase small subunit